MAWRHLFRAQSERRYPSDLLLFVLAGLYIFGILGAAAAAGGFLIDGLDLGVNLLGVGGLFFDAQIRVLLDIRVHGFLQLVACCARKGCIEFAAFIAEER